MIKGFDSIRGWLGRDTLRGRMYLILLTSSMIPLIMTGSLAFYSMTSILDNKIERGIEDNLERVLQTVEATLNNLYDVSQQMSFEGFVGRDLERLLQTEDPYEAAQLNRNIQQNVNLLNASNLNTGLMFYYDSSSRKMMYETLLTHEKQPDLESLPVMAEKSDIVFNSPHLTLYKYNDTPVFSVLRKMGDPERPLYAYVETHSKVLQQVLNMKQYGMKAFHLLTDANNTVLYSDHPVWLPEGGRYLGDPIPGYYPFTATSKQGWHLVVFISKQDYHQESRTWLIGFSMVAGFALVISLLLALRVWRMVFGPLHRIHRGIGDLTSRRGNVEIRLTGMREFDVLIDRFNGMHHQIEVLVAEVETKAKEKQDIEMEKLMAQINPHFLYNTVNTAQWLARMNGQHDIDRFLSLFTKVLKYNLAKNGKIVTLYDEIQSLRDYVELQQIRYDFDFDVRYEVPGELMNVSMPRFILQPIVENSLYHGLPETGGAIVVSAGVEGEDVRVEIRDNGKGMSKEQIGEILSGTTEETHSSGMGIGLKYVIRSLGSYTQGRGKLDIQSLTEGGTSVSFTIPFGVNRLAENDQSKWSEEDESSDRG